MSELWRDFRYVLRVLRKNPGFSALVVLTLALGLGATAAMFSVVHGVVLQPMPFEDPDQLVVIWESKENRRWPAAAGNFDDWRENNQTLEEVVMADLLTVNTGQG